MNNRFQVLLLCGLITHLAASGAGKCTDIPIQWEIKTLYVDNTPNAIQGDGSPYVNGQAGVGSIIYVCSGTFDAILSLSTNGSRSISVSFGKVLDTSANTPAWAATGQTIAGKWFLNIPNLWFVPAGKDRSQEFDFTTRFTSAAPSSSQGHVRMLNPNSDVQSYTGLGVTAPYPNSLVSVHHCPADSTPPATGACAGFTAETWFVWPDPNPTATGTANGNPITQVASVILDGKRGALIYAGEFSIPFYFVITNLQ